MYVPKGFKVIMLYKQTKNAAKRPRQNEVWVSIQSKKEMATSTTLARPLDIENNKFRAWRRWRMVKRAGRAIQDGESYHSPIA